MTVCWNELSWRELEIALQSDPLVILPVGSTEQHGPHLPLGVDLYQAVALAEGIAAKAQGYVLPPIAYGYSANHLRFAGTISVSVSLLQQLVVEVGSSAISHGVKKLLILNSHGGNEPSLRCAAQMLNQRYPSCRTVSWFWLEVLADALRSMTQQHLGTHADAIETSAMLFLKPNLVNMECAVDELPPIPDSARIRELLGQGFLRLQEETRSGVLGEPTRATREIGRNIVQFAVDELTSRVLCLFQVK